MANASNAETANNAKHLCNNNVTNVTNVMSPLPNRDLSSDSPFSRSPLVVQPVRKYVVKLCGSRLICFHRQVVWQILRGTNALSFQLLTLIAAYWLRIGPIVRPYQPTFQSSSYLFDHFAENVCSKRVTNY